jgi:hypothetical protein
MTRSSDGNQCTLHYGEVRMQRDNVQVHNPSLLWSKRKTLMDALSSVCDSAISRGFTLVAHTDWMKAWVSCFFLTDELLQCAGRELLVNSLLVCFCSQVATNPPPLRFFHNKIGICFN